MKVTIEFTGIAKAIVGSTKKTFDIPEGSAYSVLVQLLADKFPDLIGPVITVEKSSFVNATVFARNGDYVIFPGNMDQPMHEGEQLTLLFFIVGG